MIVLVVCALLILGIALYLDIVKGQGEQVIQLRRDNWWVQIAYRGADFGVPERSDICTIFWRSVRTLAIEGALAAVVGFFLSAVLAQIIYDWVQLAFAVGYVLVGSVLFFGVLYLFASGKAQSSVPAQAFKSWKERHCALVRIED